MSHLRQVFVEALNPLNKIANSIIKKLNYLESSLILRAKDYKESKDFLDKIAVHHSNSYDELSTEQKESVLQKVWMKIHDILAPIPVAVNEEVTSEDLQQIIYDYLADNYFNLYPLEKSSKELADKIEHKKG